MPYDHFIKKNIKTGNESIQNSYKTLPTISDLKEAVYFCQSLPYFALPVKILVIPSEIYTLNLNSKAF